MILGSEARINEFTAKGWWGTATISEVFGRTVQRVPDAIAAVDPLNRTEITSGDPQRLSYRQLDLTVDRLATRLLEQGIRKDDIVAVQLPNIVELVMVYLAAARIGAIVSPFPAQYREYELEQLITFIEAKVLLTTTRIGKHPHAEMAANLRPKLPSLTSILAWGEDVPDGVVALDALMTTSHDASILAAYDKTVTISANDVFTICWTSGTEGRPKGVPRSHNEWMVIGEGMIDAAELQEGYHILNPFPLVNMAGIGGMFMSWLLTGGSLVQHHPLSLPTFLKQIATEQIHFTVAPPALLNMLLQNEALLANADIRSIKAIGSGSAPLSPWMVKTWQEKYGVAIINFFGSNEGTTLISGPKEIPDPEQRAQFFPRFGVEGIAWPARLANRMQTRLVDLATGDVITEPGKPGEFLLKGVATFSGYYNADHLTQQAFDDEGYFHTGDVFEIAGDQGQFYRYVGRSKDIIIRGGMNISSEEIEALIQGYPKVAEVAVVGYPDAVLGECACACVAPRPGETVTLEELVGFLKEKKIAAFKLPERLLLVEALPRNPVGKILKHELREQVKAGVTAT
jgi:acyl-CoA synthetase (AMP-forming)/AMP-acid ligase II